MTKDEILGQYDDGKSIASIVQYYLDSDKRKAIGIGYKPASKKEVMAIVHETILKHWNGRYAK